MQVILLERVEKLGVIGDVVTVKDGFARNFLLPNKKARKEAKERNIGGFLGDEMVGGWRHATEYTRRRMNFKKILPVFSNRAADRLRHLPGQRLAAQGKATRFQQNAAFICR